jgi:hypothetical protein
MMMRGTNMPREEHIIVRMSYTLSTLSLEQVDNS